MDNQSNEIQNVDLAAFIETQSKLNNVMNKFMIETTKSLANSEESNASLLSELKRLREEKTRVEPPQGGVDSKWSGPLPGVVVVHANSNQLPKGAMWVGGPSKFWDTSYKIPVNGRYFSRFCLIPVLIKLIN